MSGMGLLMGKIRPFLTELLPFFVLENWFLACYSFTVHDIQGRRRVFKSGPAERPSSAEGSREGRA